MRTHLRIAAALFVLAGVLLIALAFGAPLLFQRYASDLQVPDPAERELTIAALGLTGSFLSIGAGLFAVPCLAAGWGIWKIRRWGRLLGITLAAILVIQFPVGTVAGAYLLWVLLSTRSESLFDPEP